MNEERVWYRLTFTSLRGKRVADDHRRFADDTDAIEWARGWAGYREDHHGVASCLLSVQDTGREILRMGRGGS